MNSNIVVCNVPPDWQSKVTLGLNFKTFGPKSRTQLSQRTALHEKPIMTLAYDVAGPIATIRPLLSALSGCLVAVPLWMAGQFTLTGYAAGTLGYGYQFPAGFPTWLLGSGGVLIDATTWAVWPVMYVDDVAGFAVTSTTGTDIGTHQMYIGVLGKLQDDMTSAAYKDGLLTFKLAVLDV